MTRAPSAATTARRAPVTESSRRSYDPDRTRFELVGAAVDLFGRKGFHATSLQEIVQAAGVTKGAFYHHFRSKEHVLHEIHDVFVDQYLETASTIVEAPGTPVERLHELMHSLVLVVARYGPNVAVFFRERSVLQGERAEQVQRKRDEVSRIYVDLVAEGVRSGDFRPDLDPQVAAFGLLGIAAWTYQWYSPEGRASPEEVASMFAGMAVRSVQHVP